MASDFALDPAGNAVDARDKASRLTGVRLNAVDCLFSSMGNFRESLTSFADQLRI